MHVKRVWDHWGLEPQRMGCFFLSVISNFLFILYNKLI